MQDRGGNALVPIPIASIEALMAELLSPTKKLSIRWNSSSFGLPTKADNKKKSHKAADGQGMRSCDFSVLPQDSVFLGLTPKDSLAVTES